MTAPEPLPSVPPEPFCKNCGGIRSAHFNGAHDLRCSLYGDSWFVPRIDRPLPEEPPDFDYSGASEALGLPAEKPPAPDDLVFPNREMTPEDLAALRVRPEEPPALKALLDELLEARRHIASGECRSWDEMTYVSEVENDVRWRVEALFASLSSQLESLQTMFANSPDVEESPAYKELSGQLERLREELNAAIKERKFAARSAILLDDQFKQVCAELESERSQLERQKAEVWEESVAATENQREADRLEEELARGIVMTPAEAAMLIAFLEATPMRYPPELVVLWKKLRRLSQQGDTENDH